MQLAPRAKGLRVFLSGLCSFPVALFVSFGLLFTRARVQFNLHCLGGWLRSLLGRGVLFHVQGLSVRP